MSLVKHDEKIEIESRGFSSSVSVYDNFINIV